MSGMTYAGATICDGTDAGGKVVYARPGDIAFPVIVDEVLGKNGAVTRQRGGGVQRIVVEIVRTFNNAYERGLYPEALAAQIGAQRALLTVEVAGGIHSWSNASVERISESGEYSHNHVVLDITFVRSAL